MGLECNDKKQMELQLLCAFLIAEIILCTSIDEYSLLFRLMGTRNPYGLSSTMYFPIPAANQSSYHINLKQRIVNSFIC